MKITSIILIIILTNFCDKTYGQRFDESRISGLAKKIIKQISTDTFVRISTSDQQIEDPEEYPYLKELLAHTKDYELCELSHHPNPIIRCYAFEGLYYKKYPKIIQVLSEHIDDTVLVATRMGCGSTEEEVIILMINLMASKRLSFDILLAENDNMKLAAIFKQFNVVLK